MKTNEQVEALIKKAAEAAKSEDAMKFSQASCNAANALAVFAIMPTAKEPAGPGENPVPSSEEGTMAAVTDGPATVATAIPDPTRAKCSVCDGLGWQFM